MDILKEFTRLDHIAVAVTDLEKSVALFTQLGLNFSSEREEVPSEKVRTAFAPIDSNSHLELLQSTDPEGPIGKYLQKKGEGLHHLCFRVSNLHERVKELKAKGFIFIYEDCRRGAHGALVNFIHPKSAGGILIELSEKEEK